MLSLEVHLKTDAREGLRSERAYPGPILTPCAFSSWSFSGAYLCSSGY